MADRQSLGLTRRKMLALVGGGATWLVGACSDDDSSGAATPDAAADAGAADGGPDAGVDTASVDAAAPDAGDDVSSDAAGEDLAADGAADAAHTPGVLSVPADDPDVAVQELSFQSDTPVRAYLATPNRPGSFAGVILIHDEHGLNEHIKDVARRFAKSGCVALVPDLASRAGGTGALDAGAVAYLAGAKPDELLADLNAAVDALAKQGVVGANRYGVCGLGWGGDLALRFAAANPRLRAAVVYYAATPTPPEIMKSTNAAILGQYASRDSVVNATIAPLARVMMDAGKTFEQHLYEADHGFNDDTSASYDEAAAVAAWALTIGWFDPHLSP